MRARDLSLHVAMVDIAYAAVRWETGLVCRTPGRTARGLILLAVLGKMRSAPVIGTELLLGAGTSNRLRPRDRVANVGVPLTVIGSFFRAFINLVSEAAAVKAKVELATALSFLCSTKFSLASCGIQNHRISIGHWSWSWNRGDCGSMGQG